MPYVVYILQSESTGRYYIGYTDNMERRLRQHNDPGYQSTKTTKRFPGPWNVVYSEMFDSRSEAMIREKQLKSWKSRVRVAQLVESRQGRD